MVNTYAGDVRLVGGRLCLDFVNTVDSYLKPHPKEYLVDYAAFVTWGQHAMMFDAAAAAELLREADRRPSATVDIVDRARALRRALYQLFSMRATGGTAQSDAAALSVINGMLGAAPRRSAISTTAWGFGWVWSESADPLERPLWLVLWSAADLLTATELAQVGQCAGKGCSWLFLDTSGTRSRRWCSMEDCGNRAKAQRHYARRRAGASG